MHKLTIYFMQFATCTHIYRVSQYKRAPERVDFSANITDITLYFSGFTDNSITFSNEIKMSQSVREKSFCAAVHLEIKPFEFVQAKYRKSFNNCPNEVQISRWVKKFKQTGSLIQRSNKGQPSISDKKLTARSPENVDAERHSVGRSHRSPFENEGSKYANSAKVDI